MNVLLHQTIHTNEARTWFHASVSLLEPLHVSEVIWTFRQWRDTELAILVSHRQTLLRKTVFSKSTCNARWSSTYLQGWPDVPDQVKACRIISWFWVLCITASEAFHTSSSITLAILVTNRIEDTRLRSFVQALHEILNPLLIRIVHQVAENIIPNQGPCSKGQQAPMQVWLINWLNVFLNYVYENVVFATLKQRPSRSVLYIEQNRSKTTEFLCDHCFISNVTDSCVHSWL